jgi:hypothetical protein
MKKFGTPIGAGPGSAYEKVGLDGVGGVLRAVADGFGAGETTVLPAVLPADPTRR